MGTEEEPSMLRHLSVAACALAITAADAHAWERNYTLRGSGWFDGENTRFGRLTMREARLTLRENGEFAVTLFVRNERYLLRGRWDRRGRGNVDRIDLRDAFGRRASGSGTLQYGFDGDHPERLSLRGRTSEGTFMAEIRDEEWFDRGNRDRDNRDRDDRDRRDRDRDRNDNDWGWGGSFDATERGNGWLRQDVGPEQSYDRIRVRLEGNRNATIVLEGRRQSLQLRGRWTQDRDNDVRIELTSVNEVAARGRLDLRRNRGNVERLDGNGRTEMGRFEVRFER